ncbi:hypothetical protein WA158_004034 [Blastocystis sp. Blastoise]
MNHHYLMLKKWHPTNKVNRMKLFVAEQEEQAKTKREKMARDELIKREEKYQFEKMIQNSNNTHEIDETKSKLDFLYVNPSDSKNQQPVSKAPKIDEESQQFMSKYLKKTTANPSSQDNSIHNEINLPETDQSSHSETTLNIQEQNAIITQHDQTNIHKIAPVAGNFQISDTANVKPFGSVYKPVKCLKCGQMGHISSDKKCPLYGVQLNDAEEKEREDPLHKDRREKILQIAGNMYMKKDTAYGNVKNPRLLTLVESSDDEKELEEEEEEMKLINSLTDAEKRLLLEKLQREEGNTMETISKDISMVSGNKHHRHHSHKHSSHSQSESRDRHVHHSHSYSHSHKHH